MMERLTFQLSQGPSVILISARTLLSCMALLLGLI